MAFKTKEELYMWHNTLCQTVGQEAANNFADMIRKFWELFHQYRQYPMWCPQGQPQSVDPLPPLVSFNQPLVLTNHPGLPPSNSLNGVDFHHVKMQQTDQSLNPHSISYGKKSLKFLKNRVTLLC